MEMFSFVTILYYHSKVPAGRIPLAVILINFPTLTGIQLRDLKENCYCTLIVNLILAWAVAWHQEMLLVFQEKQA